MKRPEMPFIEESKHCQIIARMGTPSAVLVLAVLVLSAQACTDRIWSMSKGISKCESLSHYARGLSPWTVNIPTLPGFPLPFVAWTSNCCPKQSPWIESSTMVVYAEWKDSFDRNNNWNICPSGYFLQGVYRSESNNGGLDVTEDGKCSKPADHPPYYGNCYTKDVRTCFHNGDSCDCNTDYFIAGLYRGDCGLLNCIDEFKCCKMSSSREVLDDKYKVQSRVMDITLWDMANLATYLGYGWCAGCRAEYVGEDFRRDNNVWRAAMSTRCEGYMHTQRLAIAFADWGFILKDVKFGDPILSDLNPETVDRGPVSNNHSTPLTHTLTRTQSITKTVTHTTTSAWKHSNSFGFSFGYTPPSETGGATSSMTYSFEYEDSSSTTDSNGDSHTKTFEVSSRKILAPYSAAEWKVIVMKTRRTIPYTATIIPTFSTEFQGFLRWGGGYSGDSTNYHYQHRGSTLRPTFNYKFGDADTPFYEALKRQSETNSLPWMWSDMIQKHTAVESYIKNLVNDNRYAFQLTGKFDDVDGKYVEVQWDDIPLGNTRVTRSAEAPDNVTTFSEGTHVAKQLPNDSASPPVEPPTVDVEVNVTSDSSTTPIPIGTPLV